MNSFLACPAEATLLEGFANGQVETNELLHRVFRDYRIPQRRDPEMAPRRAEGSLLNEIDTVKEVLFYGFAVPPEQAGKTNSNVLKVIS